MPLNPEDHRLSMAISPRGAITDGLRSLLVHRLRAGLKLVLRRGLHYRHSMSFYCELCSRWFPCPAMDLEQVCPFCQQRYRIEFAVYAFLTDEDG